MALRQVRVGVDESVRDELLKDMPPEAEIVRIPAHPSETLDVDLWLLPFFRKDASDVFRMLRGVRVVQSMMAGVDWILPWLPQDVVLCDGRGIHDISTSEWVLAAILTSLKRMPIYRDRQADGIWRVPSGNDPVLDADGPHQGLYPPLGDDLAEKSVLIVGYGSIGQAIESRLVPFGVTIQRVARRAKAHPTVHAVGDLPKLIPSADIVVLIVPMTAETRGLIGARELALMKPGALLVNAARGPVVITDALVQALSDQKIFAALDVTDPEPLPPGHPLWCAPNCLITPHVGGSTPRFIHRGFQLAAQQVKRFAAGHTLENIVGSEGY